ncbi:phosphate/phosphite/phosphonate ABC transporter substrate-binding protein [Cupriavidus pauculus]|uniref:Phosphate ABC transporter substrate-binding protein n=1 Tax=Cupriavidus pauculus TaxID=82633 RepID=A0A2N5CAX2_9BURK|nr:PhnD/SsuA/transferrin family substrate-binding protein [Cupriavidus pauculus]PLP99341.1 phosphate ABC transporter substrate-binding protein [Cupriavidus pauculus]
MYNVSAQLREDWLLLIDRVGQLLGRVPSSVTLAAVDPGEGPEALHAFWRRDDLLLSQTCGYPLVHGLAPYVRIIGTPRFAVLGCHRQTYRSAIVVRCADGPATIEACRGARAACNGPDSHSGMNALRHVVAPLARGGHFFGDVVLTGSHLASLAAVGEGRADVAAIDCVTLAFAAEHHPALVAGIRQIGVTRAVPGLPFIASRRARSSLVRQVRAALREALREDAGLRSRLHMDDVVQTTAAAYLPIASMALDAHRLGYAKLG